VSLAPPAFAAREWYDYYLSARDRLIPAGRCPEAIKELDEAIRLKPNPALNEQTYGLQFIDYLPYYYRGTCYLKAEEFLKALADFKLEEDKGPIRKSSEYDKMRRLRAEAQSAWQARVTRGLREEAQRLLREAGERARKKSYDEALTKLAQAEAAVKTIDPDTMRQVTEARDRIRASQTDLQEAAAKAQRIEQRLAEATKLLDDGRATEAVVALDDVLKRGPQNARAPGGKRTARGRSRAATPRPSGG